MLAAWHQRRLKNADGSDGVLLQNQTNAKGYFLDGDQSGSFTLDNP
jgi:hypothetical protein